MRLIASIPNPNVRITIMAWNGKFLLKFERPDSEQVFKLPEAYATEDDVRRFVDEKFINSVLNRFSEMESSLLARLSEIQDVK
jgi:hypothetical protein